MYWGADAGLFEKSEAVSSLLLGLQANETGSGRSKTGREEGARGVSCCCSLSSREMTAKTSPIVPSGRFLRKHANIKGISSGFLQDLAHHALREIPGNQTDVGSFDQRPFLGRWRLFFKIIDECFGHVEIDLISTGVTLTGVPAPQMEAMALVSAISSLAS